MNPTLYDQIKCVKREIAFRTRLYPKWVEKERITKDQAHAEIETMKAVERTLTALRDIVGILRGAK